MTDFRAEKSLLRMYFAGLDEVAPEAVASVLDRHVAPDWLWRGVHPFHEQRGAEAVARLFWEPLLRSVVHIQRRPDIVLAGLNEIDGQRTPWVACMGHLMGLFDRPWLGIRPTGRLVMIRFAEFHRFQGRRIQETAQFLDIPHLMAQAGQDPFPPASGVHLVQPGPLTHDGLMWDLQDPEEGRTTLRLINAMLGDMGDPARRADPSGYEAELGRSWRHDMVWWGPAGIGATYTIPRYLRQHAGPFRATMDRNRRFNGHLCRIAEGHYGGFFGWANLTLESSGGFLGMTGSPSPADMRIVDIYRRDGDRLAENWVFIDMLHYLAQQGLDVLGRMASLDPAVQSEPWFPPACPSTAPA